MKKRGSFVLILSVILACFLAFCACSPSAEKDETVQSGAIGGSDPAAGNVDGDGESEGDGETEPQSGESEPLPPSYKLYVNGVYTANFEESVKLLLDKGDEASVKTAEEDTVTIKNWQKASKRGEHVFTISENGVLVTEPVYNTLDFAIAAFVKESEAYYYKARFTEPTTARVMGSSGNTIATSTIEKEGNYLLKYQNETLSCIRTTAESEGLQTVYYSNNYHWSGNIYAYCWNESTNAENAPWPGQICAKIGTNEYGEDQYSYQANTGLYNRIIFNNNNGSKTVDMTLSAASSGYYGTNGVFPYGATSSGQVTHVLFNDAQNLSFRGGSKNVRIYTPAGYTSQKTYGVLIMFDAQNLFRRQVDEKGTQDVKGPWAVDAAITSLCAAKGLDGVIVVGIDNNDSYRNQELTMSQNFGKLDERLTSTEDDQAGFFVGKLDEVGDFILQTVLPYVRAHYSVDTSFSSLGICGSSSGGLAAYYLALRDLGTYGYVGAFSPAVGLFTSAAWEAFYESKHFDRLSLLPEVYVYCGNSDEDKLERMLYPSASTIKSMLTEAGYPAAYVKESYIQTAAHDETWWRVVFGEFAAAYVTR